MPIHPVAARVSDLDPTQASSSINVDLNKHAGRNDPRRDWGLNNDESANRLLARMNSKVDKMIEG